MTFYRRSPTRPIWKSLFDAMVFAAAFLMIALILNWFGVLKPQTGVYIAIDGDSLRNGESEIRLYGIDAPELHQSCKDAKGRDYACGQDARRALADLVREQELNCIIEDRDRYGRDVAQCNVGSQDVNAAMVRQGWAIAYRKHSLDYVAVENEARKARRGIWQGRFTVPQDWRDENGDVRTRGR